MLFNSGGGHFTDVSETYGADLQKIGLIEDLEICDFNGDDLPDLIVAGHWSPIEILINEGNKLVLADIPGLEKSNGLWNRVRTADLDNDGDLDLVAGNWGLNTRLRASSDKPIRVYLKDFDNNGKEEASLRIITARLKRFSLRKENLSNNYLT